LVEIFYDKVRDELKKVQLEIKEGKEGGLGGDCKITKGEEVGIEEAGNVEHDGNDSLNGKEVS
jgi:hypothetical protein